MNKLNIAMKLTGCLVVGLIIAGLANQAFMLQMMPVILGGAALTFVLYILNAFKSKNYGAMTAILIFAAFVLAVILLR